jgi:hypothetical protein
LEEHRKDDNLQAGLQEEAFGNMDWAELSQDVLLVGSCIISVWISGFNVKSFLVSFMSA